MVKGWKQNVSIAVGIGGLIGVRALTADMPYGAVVMFVALFAVLKVAGGMRSWWHMVAGAATAPLVLYGLIGFPSGVGGRSATALVGVLAMLAAFAVGKVLLNREATQ